jgi:hypothetical protein
MLPGPSQFVLSMKYYDIEIKVDDMGKTYVRHDGHGK